MRDLISQSFGYPVIVNNDLTAHALAEYRYGAGRNSRRFLCMVLGTGLGVGVIVDGKPLRHIEGTSGDVGRLILDPEGPEDVYGVRGSAESLCGVAGLERLAKEVYDTRVQAYEVISKARSGQDPFATEVIRQVGAFLGQTLALVCPLFLPDRIALTGGTTEAGEPLLTSCRARFLQLLGGYYQTLFALAPDYYQEPEIVIGKMRGETGVMGAVVELFSEGI